MAEPNAPTPVATPMDGGTGAGPMTWEAARAALDAAGTYWLATVRPDGAPHAVPVLAVLVDGALHFSAGARTRKARNLAADPRCVVTAAAPGVDLVVEGTAAPVTDEPTLRRVAQAYAAAYGWHPEVRGTGLWADGAPTAGPPPYTVYRVTPVTGYALTSDGTAAPTRYRFPAPD